MKLHGDVKSASMRNHRSTKQSLGTTGTNVPTMIHGDVLDLTGCFGENRLRVRELFSVINGQNKLNANNVIKADFSRAQALAA